MQEVLVTSVRPTARMKRRRGIRTRTCPRLSFSGTDQQWYKRKWGLLGRRWFVSPPFPQPTNPRFSDLRTGVVGPLSLRRWECPGWDPPMNPVWKDCRRHDNPHNSGERDLVRVEYLGLPNPRPRRVLKNTINSWSPFMGVSIGGLPARGAIYRGTIRRVGYNFNFCRSGYQQHDLGLCLFDLFLPISKIAETKESLIFIFWRHNMESYLVKKHWRSNIVKNWKRGNNI